MNRKQPGGQMTFTSIVVWVAAILFVIWLFGSTQEDLLMSSSKITMTDTVYRGFCIGFIQSKRGFRAAWRSSLCNKWCEGNLPVKDLSSMMALSRKCIDGQYKQEAVEVCLGRKLTTAELVDLYEEEKNR